MFLQQPRGQSWGRTARAGEPAWAVTGTHRLLHTPKAAFPAAPRGCQGVLSRKTRTARDALLPASPTRQTHSPVCLSPSSSDSSLPSAPRRSCSRAGQHSVSPDRHAGTARWAHLAVNAASPAADTQNCPGTKGCEPRRAHYCAPLIAHFCCATHGAEVSHTRAGAAGAGSDSLLSEQGTPGQNNPKPQLLCTHQPR